MSVLRFSAVGVLNTAIDYSLYAALLATGLTAQAANAASVTCAATFSFIANRNYTFHVRKHASPLKRQMMRHVAVTCSALAVSAAVIHVISPLAGALAAKAIAIPVSFLWNYGLSSVWVWKAD